MPVTIRKKIPLGSRTLAWASTLAFGLLAFALAVLDFLPWLEASWAVAAVALVFVPTGWWAGFGHRRRWAEAMLLPAAFALTMFGGAPMRRMLAPPLLLLAVWAAVAAAWDRVPERHRPVLAAFFGVAARAAVGVGLTGFGTGPVVVTLALAAAGPWAAARRYGRRTSELTALMLAAIPWQRWPMAGLVAVLICLAWGVMGRLRDRDELALRWLPGVGGAALFAAALAPWAGLPLRDVFPAMGWSFGIVAAVTLILSSRLPPGLAGALWLVAAFALGPASAPPADHSSFTLGGELERVSLSGADGHSYAIDLAVAGAADVAVGTPVAVLEFAGEQHVLRLGEEAAVWSATGRGPLSEDSRVAWRPRGLGRRAVWRSAVRTRFLVPAGERPVLSRHSELPEEVAVRVQSAGPSRPTSPRDWFLPQWLLAAALVVAAVQIGAGCWRKPSAVLPWLLLVLGSLVARTSVEPLRLLGERLGVDLALAAVLVAWLPAAQIWIRRRRFFTVAAALLVPLALATPHLTPPMYGDEPFHLVVMESLVTDLDLDIADNLDLERHPQQGIYTEDGRLFHSPFLGILLLPGYLIGGRGGALVLLALMGAALVSLLAGRAKALGLGEAGTGLLVLLLTATYPLATFATQIWPELPGALAVAAILVLVSKPGRGRWTGFLLAAGAAAIKTRLGLLSFLVAATAWRGGGRRGLMRGLLVMGTAAVLSLAGGWLTMGHPFGPYRRLRDLLPTDPELVVRSLGGLLFDVAGGLAFTMPLALVALAGVMTLWRRGGAGERGLLVGCGLTIVALTSSHEWYGGGSPPARYLVVMLPAFALSGAMVLQRPFRWRRLGEILLVPSLVAWWVLVTRPHLSVNPGDGGYWLADALARRFAADAERLFPSFLVPDMATLVVPAVLVAIAALAVWAVVRWPVLGIAMRRAGIAIWLVAAAALVMTLGLRYDRVVEAEAPQVRRHGGSPVPPVGTFSRFSHRNGWRLGDGEGIVIPLRIREGHDVVLEGWLLGAARRGARLEVRWDDGETVSIGVRGADRDARLRLPPPPGGGRHRLSLVMRCPEHGAGVLDRVVVGEQPPGPDR